MSNGALNFFAGIGQGVLDGMERNRRIARENKRDQREDEDYEAKRKERKRQDDEREALVTAARPVEVVAGANGMTLPETMDNRDVGLPENDSQPNGGLTPGVRVGTQTFTDPNAAATAAATANTPQAVRGRQVAALQGFDPERALKLQAAGTQVDQAEQAAADQAWRRKVTTAMVNGGHDGLADLVNKGEHGPMAGVTLKAVPSADGKTVTYNKVDAEGKLTPTALTFTNDGEGLARAAAALDQTITPADRVKLAQADAKEARESRKTDAEVKKMGADADESAAKAGYYKAAAGAQTANANNTVDGKPFKLDEDDKLRLTTANTRVRDAEKAVADAMGKLMPGDDPTKSPGVTYAQGLLRQAKLDHLRTNIELGQLPAKTMSTQILGVAKNPQEVLKSLTELASVGGADYSDQVAAEIQNSDAWKAMNPQPKSKPAAKPAAAAGMTTAAPVAAQAPAPAASSPGTAKGAPPGAEAAGQRLDQAREVVRQLQATAPGLAKGRQAIDEWRATMELAKQELTAAQQRYEQLMAPQAQAYVGGRRAMPAAASGMTAGR